MKKLAFKLMTMALAAGAMAFDAVAEGGLLPNWRQEAENLHFKVEVRNGMEPVGVSSDRLAVAEARLREIAGEKAVISLVREFVSGDELDLVPMDVERDQAIPKPFETVLIGFIDDHPDQDWSHPCRYVLFNGDLSECVIIRHSMPPLRIFGKDSGHEKTELRPVGNQFQLQSTDDTIRKTLEVIESMKATKAVVKSVMVSNAVEPEKTEKPENSYFLVISGGADPSGNGLRFWENTAIYYSTLRVKYEVPKENIVLLVSDGGASTADAYVMAHDGDGSAPYLTYISTPADLDGDGIRDVTGPATFEAVTNALADFARKLKPTDQLTVFVTSHGSMVGSQSSDNRCCAAWLFNMNPYKQEYILDSQLARFTEDIPCPVGFIIGSCFSGGFIDDILDSANGKDRVVVTSCRHDQKSHGGEMALRIDQLEDFKGSAIAFSYWTLAFNCALRGCVPASLETSGGYPWGDSFFTSEFCSREADRNGDGRISFAEAFAFTKKYNVLADPDDLSYEEPQLAESVAGLSHRFFTLRQTSTAPVLPTLTKEQAEQVSWGLQLSRVGKAVGRGEYEYACRYYGIEPKAEPQVVKEGELAVSKQALQAAKVGTLAVEAGVVSLGVNLCGTSDITAAAPDWTKLDLGKATFGLSEDGRELVIKLPVNTDSGFMTLFTKDSRLE